MYEKIDNLNKLKNTNLIIKNTFDEFMKGYDYYSLLPKVNEEFKVG
jgi:hypothetical protein